MDLSVFLLLLFVTLNFVAEYFSWNQYRVKLGVFIATLIITLPNIVFMVIDWWQSPHSKMALLVLNTFKPILRGETFRFFRWLNSVGMGLTSDELNYLPISIPNMTSDYFMTKECFDQASMTSVLRVIPENHDDLHYEFSFFGGNKCTIFTVDYENEAVVVHQLKFSKKLRALLQKFEYEEFINDPLLKSSCIRSKTYNNVDFPTAKRLASRLKKITQTEMPILSNFEIRREWVYFQAASTLDYLNEELVLIQGQGESIAVG